jgi:hypothetical protein
MTIAEIRYGENVFYWFCLQEKQKKTFFYRRRVFLKQSSVTVLSEFSEIYLDQRPQYLNSEQ